MKDGTTKSITLDRVHSWQCTETKSVNDITEVDNANTIYPEITPEKHTIGKVLLSQSKEERLNDKLSELEQWERRGVKIVNTKIEDKGKEGISLLGN